MNNYNIALLKMVNGEEYIGNHIVEKDTQDAICLKGVFGLTPNHEKQGREAMADILVYPVCLGKTDNEIMIYKTSIIFITVPLESMVNAYIKNATGLDIPNKNSIILQ